MITLIAVSFLVLLALGVPVAFVIGVSGFVGLWWSGQYPLTVVVKQIFEGVDSFVLLAIPLFILAGALMETGGFAVRLVRLAQVLVGWIRGGLSMAVVVAEYIFSGISGSTVADVSAIGSTMIPPMLRAGFRPEQAVAVVYAFIVGVFVYREIAWKDLPRILVHSAVVTAAVCFLLGTAAVVAWVLAVEQIPQLLPKGMLAVAGGNIVFLVLTAVLFILLGAVLEGLPAVVILLPTFMPVVTRLGIDVIHYSTVVVAATGIGLFLPPIGVGFFIACGIANVPSDRATPAMMPYVYMMCVGLLVIILVPWFTLILPRLLRLS